MFKKIDGKNETCDVNKCCADMIHIRCTNVDGKAETQAISKNSIYVVGFTAGVYLLGVLVIRVLLFSYTLQALMVHASCSW